MAKQEILFFIVLISKRFSFHLLDNNQLTATLSKYEETIE